ncbi:hypothetical protein HYC85_013504 [Camellia sinensis]|uniref:Uncharacterized protein n=1 Tax=Camellia sinensis TaxID=4442 RepID=A0A7J7H4S2_CAMSI|nr:hypothetical protein HYC85_013504 [Camellia sinensis]
MGDRRTDLYTLAVTPSPTTVNHLPSLMTLVAARPTPFSACKSRSVTCSSHGSISVIGRRREIGDALRVNIGLLTRYLRDFDFFGIYDEHGGSRLVHACCDRLHWLLVKMIEEEEEDGVEMTSLDWEKVMVGCFEKMDEEVSVGSIHYPHGKEPTIHMVWVAPCGIGPNHSVAPKLTQKSKW